MACEQLPPTAGLAWLQSISATKRAANCNGRAASPPMGPGSSMQPRHCYDDNRLARSAQQMGARKHLIELVDDLRPVRRLQLLHDVADMDLDRALAKVELM